MSVRAVRSRRRPPAPLHICRRNRRPTVDFTVLVEVRGLLSSLVAPYAASVPHTAYQAVAPYAASVPHTAFQAVAPYSVSVSTSRARLYEADKVRSEADPWPTVRG
eukprot:3514726-Rhodomonas_salina.1